MLRMHFLNVGHGDCTIIEHPSGRLSMIDVNNGDELDDSSQSEVLSELHRTRATQLRGQGALSSVFAQPPANPSTLGGLFGLGALPQVPNRPGLGLGLLSGALQNSPGLGFGALGLPPRDKKRELKDAGYEIALTNPVEFFLQRFPERPIFRYVQTHPDLDHMRGLSALRGEGIQIINLWDTSHTKVPDFQSDSDEEEWAEYERLRGADSGCTVLQLHRGASGAFWSEEPAGTDGGDRIAILAPTPELLQSASQADDSNRISYVLHVSYLGYRIILGGDADTEVWESIAAFYGKNIRCDVLKASHHGRDSGYLAKAVALMTPTYTVASVGKKPDTDASNKYRAYCKNVWSTRWYGNLTLQITEEHGIQWFAEYVK